MQKNTYQHLKINRHQYILTVEFNRPQRLNALNLQLMEEICDFAFSLKEDGETRVVIFTGAGKHFSSGFDLADEAVMKQFETDTRLMKRRHMRLGAEMIRRIFEIDQITIAAINGAAMGGGACIASACDFRIGAADCKAGYPEVNLAMNLSWQALPLLVRLIGPAKAKQMVILGEKIKADILSNWGFLDALAPEGTLMENANKMAEQYAKQAPVAAQMIKKSVNTISSALDQAIMHMDSDQFLYAIESKDFKEGVEAFLEGRKPSFKGN